MSTANIKKFRVGQWQGERLGVISVVTNVIYPETKHGLYHVHYGASFCSPTERQYNRKVGYALAEARLMGAEDPLYPTVYTPAQLHQYNAVFSLKKLTHDEVMLGVLMSLALDANIPDWSVDLIRETIVEGICWIGPHQK